jgi:DNA-binding MarR family transcriptional regulator
MKTQKQGGFLLARIHHLANRLLAKKLRDKQVEINPAQGKIMFVLWRNDRIPITELAQKTSLEKSTLTSMLDRLETMGYIKRVRSNEDRRVVLIECTEKDSAWQEVYVKISQEMSEIFYKGFSPPEVDRFEAYLQRILTNLVQYKEEKSL